MFRFLRGLFAGVARGLGWLMHQAIALPIDMAEGLFAGLWRALFPPPAEQEESTADVLRQVAGLITGQSNAADQRAENEMPVPREMSAARMRRAQEAALAYVTAVLQGERPPSLVDVPADMAHELRSQTRADAEMTRRHLMMALDLDEPAAEVLAPGLDHEDAPRLRYA